MLSFIILQKMPICPSWEKTTVKVFKSKVHEQKKCRCFGCGPWVRAINCRVDCIVNWNIWIDLNNEDETKQHKVSIGFLMKICIMVLLTISLYYLLFSIVLILNIILLYFLVIIYFRFLFYICVEEKANFTNWSHQSLDFTLDLLYS